jgi:hypothetical protein
MVEGLNDAKRKKWLETSLAGRGLVVWFLAVAMAPSVSSICHAAD